jgi:gluconate:H+ symporter, GntP family
MLIFYLVISVIIIIIGTTRFKIHPFLCLFSAAIFFGLVNNMPFTIIIESINDGFGKTLGNIGLVIIFGVIIGTFLEKTGGALKITLSILKLIGQKRITWTMAFMGYIISIPVFADSGFVILNSLNKTLTKKAKLSIVSTGIALAMGLMATHTMVPPTPGPVAAAGILNAKIGLVIAVGLFVSFLSLIPTIWYCQFIGKKYFLNPSLSEEETDQETSQEELPSLFKSVLPIVIPLSLIILKSFQEYLSFINNQMLSNTISFLGTPVIALGIGVIMALFLPKNFENKMLSGEGWVGKSIRDSAEILLITGAGGIFGKVLQNSGLGDYISQSFGELPIGLLLPFLIAATLKTAQGSSTIAIITAATIVSSMLPQLGLDSEMAKALTVVSIGAGSAVFSHVNDSFFWVVTQMSGINLSIGYKSLSVSSALLGIFALTICMIILIFV